MKIITTKGEAFTYDESANLAFMIYKRFGRDAELAASKWRTLLGITHNDMQFFALVMNSPMFRAEAGVE